MFLATFLFGFGWTVNGLRPTFYSYVSKFSLKNLADELRLVLHVVSIDEELIKTNLKGRPSLKSQEPIEVVRNVRPRLELISSP